VEIQWTSTGILEAERNIEDNIIIEQNSSGIQWKSTGSPLDFNESQYKITDLK